MSYIGNSPGVASQRVTTTLTATAGQTQFTTQSGYVLGYVDVYLNGAKLVNGSDFEAITGTYITLFAGAAVGDVIELISYVPRGLSDGYTKAEADAKFLDVGGDTATGSIFLGANGLTVGTDQLVASGGFVGIGTASPSNELTIQADATGVSFADNAIAQLLIRGSTDTTKRLGLGIDTTNNVGVIQAQKYGTGAYALAINPAGGNVGIGTSNPQTKLDVNGTSTFRGATSIASGNILYLSNSVNSASGTIFSPGGGSLSLASYGNEMIRLNEDSSIIFKVGSATERARIDNTGALIIGPAATGNTNSSKLVVAGTISQTVGGTQYQVVDQSDVGTGQNQIPLNQYLGSMAFQDSENINFLGGTGALSSLDITAVSTQLGVSATDIFVYDTSKDSDGGAWRKRTQHTSWYNETLNTATRGSRREFPTVAVLVGTAGGLTIYDGDSPDLPMWMVFYSGGSNPIENAPITAIYALNGTVFTGSNNATAASALGELCFLHDAARLHQGSAINQGRVSWAFSLSGRNNGNAGGWISPPPIHIRSALLDRYTYDVTMTVLPNAPTDPVSLLPVPTIAIAINAGVVVVHNNGALVSNTLGSPGNGNNLNSGEAVKVTFSYSSNSITPILFVGAAHYSSNFGAQLWQGTYPYSSFTRAYGWFNYTPIPAVSGYGFGGGSQSFKFIETGKDSDIYLGFNQGATGISVVAHNTADSTKSMVANIKTNHNTGWMPGDIKGAWLSDTLQETVTGTNLISNGTFDSNTTGWTAVGSGASISWNAAGRINVTPGSEAWSGAYTTVQVVAGKTYVITGSIISSSIWAGISGSYDGGQASAKVFNGAYPAAADYNFTHTATQTGTLYITIDHSNTSQVGTIVADNISVRLAEPDRTHNTKAMQVYGTVVKTPVAVGSDLVAYSNFTTSNYLQTAPGSITNVGTGDFSLSYWAYHDGGASDIVIGAFFDGDGGSGFRIAANQAGDFYVIQWVNTGWANYGSLSGIIPMNQWHHLTLTRRSGTCFVYVNGLLRGTIPFSYNLTASSRFTVGSNNTAGTGIKFALVKYGFTPPTPEQVTKMYNDEKVLFQENAKATLYGTSDLITALAYDEDTKRLHAGTSSGRSVFQGLRRVDNTTTAVSAAISAADGLVAEN